MSVHDLEEPFSSDREHRKRSTSPCVDLQILKLEEARLIRSNALLTIFQYTQAAVPASLALVV